MKNFILLFVLFLSSPCLKALTREECANMIKNWDVAMDMLLGLHKYYTTGVKINELIKHPRDYGVYLHEKEKVQLYRQRSPVCRFHHSNFFTSDILFSRQWLYWRYLAPELKKPNKELYCHFLKNDEYGHGQFHVCCLIDKPKEEPDVPDEL